MYPEAAWAQEWAHAPVTAVSEMVKMSTTMWKLLLYQVGLCACEVLCMGAMYGCCVWVLHMGATESDNVLLTWDRTL